MKNQLKAKIYRSSSRVFNCKVLENSQEVEATALANLLKEGEVVVGDEVLLEKTSAGDYQIIQVLPRKNEIYRFSQRERTRKIMAANCDLLIIMTAVSRPEYKSGLVDRYLVRAANWNLQSVVVFNKMDEYQNQVDLDFEQSRLEKVASQFFRICALTSNEEMLRLKEFIQGKTALLLGQSGVGKSKLITALTDGKVELKSGHLGKVGKGMHTTSWCEMIEGDGFLLIDSPGIRSYSIDDLLPEEVEEGFFDLDELRRLCQFSNCEHQPNSKGCAFYQLDPEDDKNAPIFSRLCSYLNLRAEALQRPKWDKKNQ